eukprot:TRINITY_DN376_c1_g1_i1.p1 TRINITY_DN376_c1_g1~~TRINITY_DN376_c1_g1_i1.p1  ORF type:complete len:265 (+),score=90.58 TRINITY_DN376_c1_g1_i1:65-796(+)
MSKVFVGNLAFRATDNSLQELFSEAGTVVNASIITRGRRALGYGFVDMSSPEEAVKAVELLHGRELHERVIKVEVAKDPATNVKKTRKPKESGEEGETEEGENGGQGRRGNKRRRARQPREKKEQRPKVDSETTVFVANLPFSVDDESLLAIFADVGAVSAHVVLTRNNRSRGYGFVEFADKDAQTAGIEAKNGFEVESETGARAITVSVSTSTAPPVEETVQTVDVETEEEEVTPASDAADE